MTVWNGLELPESYFHDDDVCIIHGDSREILSSIHGIGSAVATDPPYELGFMGKSWDSKEVSFQKETWEVIRQACKSGAMLLSFGGSRTQHRIACAIEDGGWEIRDTLMWVYGCLSEDTEVLTEYGWRQLHKLTTYDRILIYDIQNKFCSWEKPQGWYLYRVYNDTTYRIISSETDQIVSRGHRCLVEQNGELVFKRAEELGEMEFVPVLQESDIPETKKGNQSLLFEAMFRESKGLVEEDSSSRERWLDNRRDRKPERKDVRREKSSVERWSNLFQNTRQLQGCKVHTMPTGLYLDGTKGRLRDGTPFASSSETGSSVASGRDSASQQPRPFGQQSGSVLVCQQQRPQTLRGRKTYQTTLARVYQQSYSGLIFCPTVSTGAFVARRDGKVFITGNSGFPKSLDISKAIDKSTGQEREMVGVVKGMGKQNPEWNGTAKGRKENSFHPEYAKTAPSAASASWNGYGTALKPAYEPIILAMNPLDKTFANNALKHGVAGLNIDECRVGIGGDYTVHNGGVSGSNIYRYNVGIKSPSSREYNSTKGRFPANFLHDGSEEVLELFPQTGKSSGGKSGHTGAYGGGYREEYYNGEKPGFGDNGSAARFFYCAKASKSERGVANNHPTVKPIALMEHLINLVKMPEYNLIIDPFCGSGSTLLACAKLGIPCIGIDSDEQSCELSAIRYLRSLDGGDR